MCSIQDEGTVCPEKKINSTDGRTKCTKCQQPAVIIIRVDHTFCQTCFLTYASHKFRSTFGKSRLVRDGEKVMVAFSGGNSSTALLHLCLEGKSPRAPKKLRFQASLVYIDEGAVLGWTAEERVEASQPILTEMEKSGLPCYVYMLEQALSSQVPVNQMVTTADGLADRMHQLSLDVDAAENLKTMLEAAKTLTAKESLLHTLRQRLLVSAAASTGHTKIFLGDACTRLSVRLLSDITQGRGAHVAHELAFGDARFGDIMILRPLREFLSKEIVMYNTLHGLQSTVLPNLATKVPLGGSLDRLAENFVCGLQAEFPATVSTIFRTGTKLDPKGNSEAQEVSVCVMCKSPMDTDVPECSALSATQFSWSLSRKRPMANQTSVADNDKPSSVSTNQHTCEATKAKSSHYLTNQCAGSTDSTNQSDCCADSANQAVSNSSEAECCGQGDGSCRSKKFVLRREDLLPLLCYGCRIVLNDVKNLDVLPDYIQEEAGRRIRRNLLHGSIQEFLLDDTTG